MKRVAVFSVAALLWAADPPAPIKLSDAERLKVRDAQIEVMQIQASMKQLEDLYKNLQQQLQTTQPALDKVMADLKKAHGCESCEFDKDLNLIPKSAPKKK